MNILLVKNLIHHQITQMSGCYFMLGVLCIYVFTIADAVIYGKFNVHTPHC